MINRLRDETRKLAKGIKRRVVPARLRLDLRDEERMLEGRMPIPESGPQSVVLFTVHKCASTFTSRAFAHLTKEKLGLRQINMARYFWRLKDGDVYEHIQANADRVFHPNGFFYGPLRQPVEIPNVDRFKTILMLRDPRDVLTSFYYSITISHGLPATPEAQEQFMAQRRKWEDKTVDEFVLGWLPEFRRRYEGYLRIRDETGCPLLRYEDMLTDFDRWAEQLGDALGIDLTTQDIEALRVMGGFDREVEESASRHIRQRTPGDYRRKLQPATVDTLTQELGPVLRGFGYD